MLLPIRPICSKNKVRKDGTSLIFIQYCFTSDSKTLLNTELAIPSKYWNRKLLRVSDDLPKEYGDYKEINKELQRCRFALLRILYPLPLTIGFRTL
jgi:hypothetical protein